MHGIQTVLICWGSCQGAQCRACAEKRTNVRNGAKIMREERTVTMVDNQKSFSLSFPILLHSLTHFVSQLPSFVLCYHWKRKTWQAIYYISILLRGNTVMGIYGKCQQLSFAFTVYIRVHCPHCHIISSHSSVSPRIILVVLLCCFIRALLKTIFWSMD